MNPVVIESRKKITSTIENCFYALDEYAHACSTFRDERRRIEQLPYLPEAKETHLRKASDTLFKVSSGIYEAIAKNLNTIEDAAKEMAELLDVGQEFQNTLSVIKQVGKSLPVDSLTALIDPFKGQKRALEILRAAYADAGIATDYYFGKLIFDPESRLAGLNETAYRIAVQPGDNLLVASDVAKTLEEFADNMGAELTVRPKDMKYLSEAYTDALIRAFGANPN